MREVCECNLDPYHILCFFIASPGRILFDRTKNPYFYLCVLESRLKLAQLSCATSTHVAIIKFY